MVKNELTKAAEKSLGSSASYAIFTDKFDSSLLNPLPRDAGRKDWDIDTTKFSGVDVWHCHEASFLLDSGKPVSGILKFAYDCQSEFMIESKSMKLYLNSFDMCRMGSNIHIGLRNYEIQIKNDLETVLKTKVKVSFFFPHDRKPLFANNCFNKDNYLDSMIVDSTEFTDYNSKQYHLKIQDEKGPQYRDQLFWTNSLRSRCRVTQQKDTGSAFISAFHSQRIDPVSVLKQIVSLRESAEFHELCADVLISKLIELEDIERPTLALFYNRRGSLDINPIRWRKTMPSKNEGLFINIQSEPDIFNDVPSVFSNLADVYNLTQGAFGQ